MSWSCSSLPLGCSFSEVAGRPPGLSLAANSRPPLPGWCQLVVTLCSLPLRQYKHLFVHIGRSASYEPLEAIGITQIYDKFPDKKGGLRELYDKGPANAFFLVKFWADLNTSIQVSRPCEMGGRRSVW